MASYHFAVQMISRSKGRSSLKAAAYRSGQRLHDEAQGEVYDYRRRRGVVHQEVMLPERAAAWLGDREQLWNHVERMEKRRDAQLAREINMALPHELTDNQRLDLVREFVRQEFTSRGMVADVAIHRPVSEKGEDYRNVHAHVMLTLRQGEAAGLRAVKTREWNSDSLLQSWRTAWAESQNRSLERAGHRDRVDHRRLEVQREEARRRGDRRAVMALDRTPEIHVGPRARAAEWRGGELRSKSTLIRTARPVGGTWYSSRSAAKRVRMLAYGDIDRGSRLAHNIDILAGRLRGSYDLVDKLERQAARLRQRHACVGQSAVATVWPVRPTSGRSQSTRCRACPGEGPKACPALAGHAEAHRGIAGRPLPGPEPMEHPAARPSTYPGA